MTQKSKSPLALAVSVPRIRTQLKEKIPFRISNKACIALASGITYIMDEIKSNCEKQMLAGEKKVLNLHVLTESFRQDHALLNFVKFSEIKLQYRGSVKYFNVNIMPKRKSKAKTTSS